MSFTVFDGLLYTGQAILRGNRPVGRLAAAMGRLGSVVAHRPTGARTMTPSSELRRTVVFREPI